MAVEVTFVPLDTTSGFSRPSNVGPMLLSDAIVLEDPAPQYQVILVARQGAVNSAPIQQLVNTYKSAEYRRFVESDPKSKGFSKPDYWR